MIKPSFLESTDRPTVVGRVFGTPLVVKGWSGLPLIELVAWGILSWAARSRHPEWSRLKQVYAGALAAALTLGSEWCHNLAHAAAASWIGKPVDAIRIFWGTPLLIYYDINDPAVSPRQHLMRASGGPLFSTLMVVFTSIVKGFFREGTLSRYAADFASRVNTFISSLALLPIPFLDGGPLLKWSLVERGRNPKEAELVVKGANRFVGYGLAAASGFAYKKHKVWLCAALAGFAATCLAIGFGLLKEQKDV